MDEDRAFGNISIGLVDPIRQVYSTLTPLVRCQARLILSSVRRLCGAWTISHVQLKLLHRAGAHGMLGDETLSCTWPIVQNPARPNRQCTPS